MSADTLHRSLIDAHNATGGEALYAFILAACPEAASRKLQAVLPAVLCEPAHRIRILFTMSEAELLARARGKAYTRDARLLEIGSRPHSDGELRIAYADPGRTLLLLPPPLLLRMRVAQWVAEQQA